MLREGLYYPQNYKKEGKEITKGFMKNEGSTDSRKRQREQAEAVGGGSQWLNGGRYALAAGLKVAEMSNTDTLSSCVIPTVGDANMVNISFRRENGSTFGMTFRPSDNIFTVKESIQAASDLAVARQTLRFKNLILQDEGTLAGYGIHDRVIVDLLVARVLDEVILVKVKLMYRRPTYIAVTMGARQTILCLKAKIKEKRRNIAVDRMRVYHPITDEHLSSSWSIKECDILLSGVVVYFLDSDMTLQRANDLVRNNNHPTSIINTAMGKFGRVLAQPNPAPKLINASPNPPCHYSQCATQEACEYAKEKLAVKVEKLGKDSLISCAKTSMSSKLIAGDSDFFANLVVDAMLAGKMTE